MTLPRTVYYDPLSLYSYNPAFPYPLISLSPAMTLTRTVYHDSLSLYSYNPAFPYLLISLSPAMTLARTVYIRGSANSLVIRSYHPLFL